MILIYILELFPGKSLHFGTFLFFSLGKVPKCKLFSFTNWNFLFSSLEKIFSRPNSGDKKMKFYILELFLPGDEAFQNIFHFKKIFEKNILREKSSPEFRKSSKM